MSPQPASQPLRSPRSPRRNVASKSQSQSQSQQSNTLYPTLTGLQDELNDLTPTKEPPQDTQPAQAEDEESQFAPAVVAARIQTTGADSLDDSQIDELQSQSQSREQSQVRYIPPLRFSDFPPSSSPTRLAFDTASQIGALASQQTGQPSPVRPARDSLSPALPFDGASTNDAQSDSGAEDVPPSSATVTKPEAPADAEDIEESQPDLSKAVVNRTSVFEPVGSPMDSGDMSGKRNPILVVE